MGYTHYWTRAPELPAGAFNAAVSDCQKALALANIALAGPRGRGSPLFDREQIAFNGAGKQGFESFCMPRRATPRNDEEDVFDFCKTARQPYDLGVQISLIICAHHFGKSFRVRSDGGDDEWAAARLFCQEHLGYGQDFALTRP